MIGMELQAGTYAADEFGDRQLADAAEQINVLSRQTTANIVRIGQLLVQAKAQCTHGQWGAGLYVLTGDHLYRGHRRAP